MSKFTSRKMFELFGSNYFSTSSHCYEKEEPCIGRFKVDQFVDSKLKLNFTGKFRFISLVISVCK